MTPVELSRTVLSAVRRAVEAGELVVPVPERVVVGEPGAGGCGDFATTVALRLARPAGLPPLKVAEVLRAYLLECPGIRDVVVTGPGFLNISLAREADPAVALVREIRELGSAYGHSDLLAGQVVVLRVPYEVRAEVVADAVVRIVASQGGRAEVEHGEPVNLRPVPAPEDPAPLGADAAQWALLHPAPHDRPRITADHLAQRESNPLFRVRYAHARVRSVVRNAGRLGFAAEPGPIDTHIDIRESGAVGVPGAGSVGVHGSEAVVDSDGGSGALGVRGSVTVAGQDRDRDRESEPLSLREPGPVEARESSPVEAPAPTQLHEPAPAQPHNALPTPLAPLVQATPSASPPTPLTPLLAALSAHPRILAAAARHRAPDRLARHLVTLADAVLPFLYTVLPCGEEKPSAAHRARLALAEAAGTVLAGGLSLLGIDAPEHL
ncbi:DALR anticodon-binding domain-containing protein [Streptomyces sp. WI03-4A]|uniref:ArgS-related anticodon-binding protein NrtL n=1 Tax=Streptomyces sp. WI03-4A TaxID=3028706 RepID=UPI0029B051B7|nr:DALR anticodon-binding domain-containing protein [Streptomyces sp. WI03-4A]MDX2595271.1 DALR anticodon-binding domain-containing protein [Streptomyces sp. WI03-4A]